MSLLALVTLLAPQAAESAPASDGLRWIDLVGLGLVALFALLGLLRGLWWQVFRLVAVCAAVAIARVATPPFVAWAAPRMPGMSTTILTGISWVLLFVAVMLVAAVVGRLGKKSLEAAQLSAVDRVGGLVAGAVTGAALHVVLVVGLDHLAPRSFAESALAGTWSASVYDAVGTELPQTYAGDSEPEAEPEADPDADGVVR